MKARELAEILMQYPDFEAIALCTDESMSRRDNGYIGYERFLFSEIADVGTVDKEVIIKIDIDRTTARPTPTKPTRQEIIP